MPVSRERRCEDRVVERLGRGDVRAACRLAREYRSVPVVAHSSIFVHGAFVDHVEWSTRERLRVAQSIRIIDRVTDRTFLIVHLHGLRDPSGKGDTPARMRQARRLREFVTATRDPADVTIVCGDLNLLPDSATFAILGEIGLTDLVGSRDTRTSRYCKPVRHANYLLVSDTDMVKKFDAPALPEVSDHRPLVLVV